MSLPEIPGELVSELRSKLDGGDLTYFESAYKSGKLDTFKAHLSPADWIELPKRIVAKDIAWVRNLFGGLFGKLNLGGGASAAGAAGAALTGGGIAAGLSGAADAANTAGLSGAADAAKDAKDAGSGMVGKLVGAGAGALGIGALVTLFKDKLFSGGKINWDWLHGEHKAGNLDSLKEHMSDGEWKQFGSKIESKDEGWLKGILGKIPGLGALFGAGAAAAAVTGAVGAVGATTKKVEEKVGGVTSSAKAGAQSTVTKTVATQAAKKGGLAWWKWLLPLVVLGGLLIWGLTKCGSSSKTTVSPTTGAPTTTTTAAPATTAKAAEVTTTAAPATTVAPVTTTAAPVTTTAAPAPTTTAAPAPTTAAPAPTTAAPAPAAENLVACVSPYKTLTKLLTDAGLVDTLKGPGPFTVFAPTDEAFAAVPKATLDQIAANPELLKRVLTYHVVAGAVKSTDLKLGSVATLNKSAITVGANGTNFTINSANVTKADKVCSNGVLHVLDKVLIPGDLPSVL
jgi:uncharacterized surface protein with fasciclin (FAS1) repeats